jgi:hypothetical protein
MTAILKVDEIQDTSGNLIIKEDSNTITLGASGDTITIPSGATLDGSNATLSGFATTNGITMADQFRLTANQSGGTNAVISSNLERVDTDGFGQLGTGLTESSGIFSFPSTGIYLISLIGFMTVNGADGAANVSIETTTDNSTYGDACIVTAAHPSGAGALQFSVAGHFIFDVTNTSTHKFRLKTHSMGGSSFLMGETDRNRTAVTVIRLGDT